MTIFTAINAVYTVTFGSWANPTNGFDGDFSTFARLSINTGSNDSSTVGASTTASYNAAADSEPIRIAKCRFTLTASGVSATRRGRLVLLFSTNGGNNFSAGTTAKDEFGNDVTWFGTDAAFNGTVSLLIPPGVSAANFQIRLKGESPGDNRGFINNRLVTFDIYEFFIDTVNAAPRVLSMMLPEPS